MKKKIIFVLSVILIVATLAMCLVACDKKGNGNNDNNGGNNGGSTETPITSEVGQSYAHTKTAITYASDEVKAEILDEMEKTEKQFYDVYDQATLEVKFLADNKATITYNMAGRGEVLNLLYKVESGIVTFYDTEEDMESGNAKTDRGIFSAQFKLSTDFRTLYWIADMAGKCKVTLDCTIK